VLGFFDLENELSGSIKFDEFCCLIKGILASKKGLCCM
jgi:hypothetical protein